MISSASRMFVKTGKAGAAVSAGNTGALMAMAKLALRTMPGIDRPAILTASSSMEKPDVRKVLSADAIVYLQKQINTIEAAPLTINYVARLVRATRPKDVSAPKFIKDLVSWGAGPRAGQFLIAGAKALAAMDGRPAINIDDVRKVAIPVLRHRVTTNFQAQAEGVNSETIIHRLIAEIPEPKIAKYE